MRSKIFFSGLFVALSMVSSLSFAECGMDRKLELLKDLNEILEEKADIYKHARNDKRSERRVKYLEEREREVRYEYEVVCNVE